MLPAAIWLLVQEALLVVDCPRATAGPVPIACGLREAPPEGRAAWRPVRIAGGAPAVLVRTPFGAAVHAVLPGVAAGAHPLRLERGAGTAPRPARVSCDGSGAVWECDAWRVGFDRDGSVEIGDESCRLWPPGPRDGQWSVRAGNPVRTVLAWESEATTLYAILHAGVRAVELTLVVREGGSGEPGPLGLDVRRDGDEAPEWPPEPEPETETRPDDEPPFELVVESLRSALWEPVAPSSPGGAALAARRFGPTSPVEPPREGPVLAIAPWEAPAPGETRVLRLRIGEGERAGDALARPGRAAPPDCGDLVALRRKLDAALAAFRADPRHGLLHRRGDFGDWRMDLARVGNLEWDSSLGFLLRWTRSGDRADGVQALAGVEHLLVRDRDPETGLFFQHGREHRSGIVEPGHHWVEGVAAVAHWSCDPWLEDEARALAAAQLAAFERMSLETALPRCLGWALTALCALHPLAADRSRSEKLIAKMEKSVLSRQSDAGHFQLESSTAREGGFRVCPFVDGGILLPALERSSRITRSGAAAFAIARAREALWRDGVVREPDGTILVSSILIAPRSGRAVAKAGRAEGEEVVLFLSGVAGSGPDVLESGLLRRAASSLTLDDRVLLGKGISMLMRAIPAYAARRRCG
jgi:hypothetical protein